VAFYPCSHVLSKAVPFVLKGFMPVFEF